MCQFFLCQLIHHIGLVFAQIRSLFYLVLASGTVIGDTGVMTGGKIRGIEIFTGGIIKKTEFNFKVTNHAGIRGDSVFIGTDKIGHDFFLINVSHINDLVGDFEKTGHIGGIAEVLSVEDMHGCSVHIVACLLQQASRQSAVDTARHGNDNLFLFFHKISFHKTIIPGYNFPDSKAE